VEKYGRFSKEKNKRRSYLGKKNWAEHAHVNRLKKKKRSTVPFFFLFTMWVNSALPAAGSTTHFVVVSTLSHPSLPICCCCCAAFVLFGFFFPVCICFVVAVVAQERFHSLFSSLLQNCVVEPAPNPKTAKKKKKQPQLYSLKKREMNVVLFL
jgi:hypothetical protein